MAVGPVVVVVVVVDVVDLVSGVEGGLTIDAVEEAEGGVTNSERNRSEETASGRASCPKPPSIPLIVAGTVSQYFSASVYQLGDSVGY